MGSMQKNIGSLAPLALALVSLTILIGVGGITLAELETTSYDTQTVTAEKDSPSTPLPTNYTLDASNNNDYVKTTSTTVVLEDGSAGTNNTLTEDTDYTVFASEGKIELQSSPGGISYNSSEDTVYTDYDYQEESTASGVIGSGQSALQTFSDFFTVIVVVGIAAVIFLILTVLRRTSERGMA